MDGKSREFCPECLNGHPCGFSDAIPKLAGLCPKSFRRCIPPDWQPVRKRKRKKKRTPEPSQQEQIFEAARIIAERDLDILGDDLSRVEAAAERRKSHL